MSDNKSRCALCDEWYTPADAWIHKHPEPQSGPPRDAWLASKLPYMVWLSGTDEGRAWGKEHGERAILRDPNAVADAPESLHKDTQEATQACPHCKGDVSSLAFVNTGEDISGHHVAVVNCTFCDGTGTVSQEKYEHFQLGKILRQIRVFNGKTLGEQADELILTPAILSAIERGSGAPCDYYCIRKFAEHCKSLDALAEFASPSQQANKPGGAL